MAARTDHDERTDADAAAPAPKRRGPGPVARAVSVLGELLITAGLVLGLFVVYSLWWTNVVADRAADKQGDKVRHNWAADKGPGALDTKAGIGFLHVPSMRNGEVLVEKGTETEILNDGVAGYYTDPVKSSLPMTGKDGNFTLAAHRDGHGAKFHDLDQLAKGDAIVVETRDKWYVYQVDGTLPQTSKYDTGIIEPVPVGSPYQGPGRYITLTTCTPVYTSRYRMAVWGSLVRVDEMDPHRTPPPELR